jgi:hypothetical protein
LDGQEYGISLGGSFRPAPLILSIAHAREAWLREGGAESAARGSDAPSQPGGPPRVPRLRRRAARPCLDGCCAKHALRSSRAPSGWLAGQRQPGSWARTDFDCCRAESVEVHKSSRSQEHLAVGGAVSALARAAANPQRLRWRENAELPGEVHLNLWALAISNPHKSPGRELRIVAKPPLHASAQPARAPTRENQSTCQCCGRSAQRAARDERPTPPRRSARAGAPLCLRPRPIDLRLC